MENIPAGQIDAHILAYIDKMQCLFACRTNARQINLVQVFNFLLSRGACIKMYNYIIFDFMILYICFIFYGYIHSIVLIK